MFTTGGTIAMKYDAEKGGLVPAVSGADLAAAVPGLDKVADVEVREFSNVASCNMSPERMFALSHAIEEALKADDVAGAVVTHGTDTLEETSYFLDLLHPSEKPICVVGAMHAREHITTSYLMRCIEDYAAGYYSQSGWLDGYNVRNLLDKYTLYIVPNCNPDGTEIVLSGESPATQVITTSKGAYKANANGVNLNRNFPFGFGTYEKMSTLPHESTFPGQFAASEPETQALISLCEENSFELVLSFHIQGECVYWSDAINVNTANSELLADRISKAYGFYKCPTSTELSLFGGGFENWFRYTFSRPGFCIELMPLEYEVHPLSDYDNINMENSLRYSHTRSIMLSAIS